MIRQIQMTLTGFLLGKSSKYCPKIEAVNLLKKVNNLASLISGINCSISDIESRKIKRKKITDWSFSKVVVIAVRSAECGLEDASVAAIAQKFNAAVWTFDYRDLSWFKNLQLWTPSG